MKSLLASLLLVSSFAAFAEMNTWPAPLSRCELTLRLSDSQKIELQEISRVNAESLKTHLAQLSKARAAAKAVLVKPEASKQEAHSAAHAVIAKQAEVSALIKSAELSKLFDVLTVEQRVKKLKCEKALRESAHRRPHYTPSRPAPHRPHGPVVVRPGRPHRPYHAPAPRYPRGPRVGRGHPVI